MLRFCWFILLLAVGFKCLGQVPTFSRTYPDTMNLSGLPKGSCIEYNGAYYCANKGIGLSIIQGGYLRILKLGKDGQPLNRYWVYDSTRRYSGSPMILGKNKEIILCADRSVKGQSQPKSLVVKWISTNLQEIRQFENPDSTQFDTSEAILEAESGRIYAVGARAILGTVPSNLNGFILVLEADGRLVNFNVIDEGRNEYFNSIVPCADGGFFLGGATSSFGDNQGYLVKVDADGNKLWSKGYPLFSSAHISSISDTTLLLAGTTITGDGFNGVHSLVDTSGEVKFTKDISYPMSFSQYSSKLTTDSKIVTVGLTGATPSENNAGYIALYDLEFNTIWQRRYNYNANTDFFVDVIETSDGGFLVSGAASDTDGTGQNLWLVKLDSMGCLEPGCWEVGTEDAKENELGVMVFPNPASEWLNFKLPGNNGEIRLEVFSISGKRVMNTTLFAPLEAIQVNHLPLGLYLLRFTDEKGTRSTQRIVIAR